MQNRWQARSGIQALREGQMGRCPFAPSDCDADVVFFAVWPWVFWQQQDWKVYLALCHDLL